MRVKRRNKDKAKRESKVEEKEETYRKLVNERKETDQEKKKNKIRK